ncbi:hypothetical protein B0H16DRAFT_1469121 [Mycena metata]|uniref:Uncharacterized protein n=1 Tax=Mycena metata TaxID=1033252 RepID=A0AAD7HZ21_9AGAR|nr:hypothetical protein B0H16DRAFT_1469121 [Mycena metata]
MSATVTEGKTSGNAFWRDRDEISRLDRGVYGRPTRLEIFTHLALPIEETVVASDRTPDNRLGGQVRYRTKFWDFDLKPRIDKELDERVERAAKTRGGRDFGFFLGRGTPKLPFWDASRQPGWVQTGQKSPNPAKKCPDKNAPIPEFWDLASKSIIRGPPLTCRKIPSKRQLEASRWARKKWTMIKSLRANSTSGCRNKSLRESICLSLYATIGLARSTLDTACLSMTCIDGRQSICLSGLSRLAKTAIDIGHFPDEVFSSEGRITRHLNTGSK